MKNLPLYLKIKEYVLALIMQNKSDLSYMLPSESQIMLKFSSSRMTVRKALTELEEENLIYKIHGKGSFIKAGAEVKTASTVSSPSDTVALILPNRISGFLDEVINGVSDFCRSMNLCLINLVSYSSNLLEAKNISAAENLGCKGILLMPVDDDNYSDEILRLSLSKKPTVFIDRKLYGMKIPCVSSNHYDIGYKATKYLSKNHKHIAIATLNNNISAISERIRGYNDALYKFVGTKRININISNHIKSLSSHENLFTETVNLLKTVVETNPEITGFIANSGDHCLAVIKAMSSLGKKLNEDYEIVSIDRESEFLERLNDTKMPSIIQNTYQIGYTAASILYQQIYSGIQGSDITVPLLNNLED